MGECNYKGRDELIKGLKKVSNNFKPIPFTLSFIIKNSTEHILLLKRQLAEIRRMIEKITNANKAVKTLEHHRGI